MALEAKAREKHPGNEVAAGLKAISWIMFSIPLR